MCTDGMSRGEKGTPCSCTLADEVEQWFAEQASEIVMYSDYLRETIRFQHTIDTTWILFQSYTRQTGGDRSNSHSRRIDIHCKSLCVCSNDAS